MDPQIIKTRQQFIDKCQRQLDKARQEGGDPSAGLAPTLAKIQAIENGELDHVFEFLQNQKNQLKN